MGGAGKGVEDEQLLEQGAGAGGGLDRKGERARVDRDGAVGVGGKIEVDGLVAGGDGGGDGGLILWGGEALLSLTAAVEEEGKREQDAGGKGPEEVALVAGDHGWALPGGWAATVGSAAGRSGSAWPRQKRRAVATAWATRAW